MRSSFLTAVFGLGLVAAASSTLLGATQAPPPADELALIACAKQIHAWVGPSVWPGWSAEPFPVLLVTADREFLVCPPPGTEGFEPVTVADSTGCPVAARPRSFPPKLLATFPAVAGVSTIVVGTPQAMEDRIAQNLAHPALDQIKRVAFYSLGAAMAQLLDEMNPQWKREYLKEPFQMDRYLGL